MRFIQRALVATLLACLAVPGAVLAHDNIFDHAPPMLTPQPAPSPAFQSGGEGAEWELIASLPTGNPHSDLDFFTQGDKTFASVGTFAIGPNGGGQTIVQLAEGDEVAPRYVSQEPTASCVSNPAAATGLQHDVEASPKGKGIQNTFNPYVDARDAQVILDATDQRGRCHDQGTLGLRGVPRGGIEIIDVTDIDNPQTIGLTSHSAEAHTVNVDPKRPHIAYAVTSSAVSVDSNGRRQNEGVEGESSPFELDGWEMIDMSSCMNFPAGTSLEEKRNRCRPQVYRYRYPSLDISVGHSLKTSVYGCHELEVYPNDRLTCGSGAALMLFDMLGAFDDRGTPDDFSDDRLRGTPLPCSVRDSSSAGPFATGAKVTDCVDPSGDGSNKLAVGNWVKGGSQPSLEGVKHLGSAFHMGRGGPRPVGEDIDFNHEAEYSHSGNFLFATDERGGGITPPGASCNAENADPTGQQNGGLHAYRADKLLPRVPATAQDADTSYARTSKGEKSIFRASVRTGVQATVCTAHVFQQIPGQNRIFMGWYSQGTQVIDYVENADGTLDFKEAGFFLPANANEWVSHVFKTQANPDGTITYYGAAADFNLGERGRNAIDVYRVTLPAPPTPADGPGVLPDRVKGKTVTDPQTGRRVVAGPGAGAPSCTATSAFRSASVRQSGRRIGFAFRADGPVTIDLFQQSSGRRVIGERLVKRFRNVRGSLRWDGRDRRGRRLGDGYYVARFGTRGANGQTEYRRVALRRAGGRFRQLASYEGRDSCSLVRSLKAERPVFGGRGNRALSFSFRAGDELRATVTVARAGGRVVKRYPERAYRGGQLHRFRLTAKATRFPPGRYVVTVSARGADGQTVRRSVSTTRL